LAELVRYRRRTTGSLGPSNFTFHEPSRSLYFLGSDGGDETGKPLTSLYRTPFPKSLSGDDQPMAGPWIPVATAVTKKSKETGAHQSGDPEMTKKAELLRERLRMQAIGITSYSIHESTGRILVPIRGELRYCETVSSDSTESLTALNLHSFGDEARSVIGEERWRDLRSTPELGSLDPKWSPDGALVSFIRHDDLWVADVATGVERQLTFSMLEKGDVNEGDVTSGVAEYVMQEEFDRYTGYWWQSHRDPSTKDYVILYLQVDQSEVPSVGISQVDENGSVDYYRYPRVGDKNVTVEARLIRFPAPPKVTGSEDIEEIVRWADCHGYDGESIYSTTRYIPNSLKNVVPWFEYVVRGGWIPANDPSSSQKAWFWLMFLDREQQRLALVAFSFNDVGEWVILHKEHLTRYWINVSDSVVFVPYDQDANNHKVSFIYTSERSGFSHLYTKQVSLSSRITASENQITGGNWAVEEILRVDMSRMLIFFTGTMDSPLEKHIYVTKVAPLSEGSSEWPLRLTEKGFTYSNITVDVECRWLACNRSSVDQAVTSEVFEIVHSGDKPVLRCTVKIAKPKPADQARPSWGINTPEFFNCSAENGDTLYGCMFLPRHVGAPYPTILHVYGGPRVQSVSNDYRLTSNGKLQFWSDMGFLVVMIDGRGSYRRGLEFEGAIHGHLGDIELQDQAAGLEYLIAKGLVDRNRIAISGWSYGGYLSLLALAKRPDLFKLAIAGAPVVRWENYDTAYTERYLGLLSANPEGYRLSSVLHWVPSLPDEDNRLLVVHCLMDENVHACHTTALIDAMVRENKPHRLLLFPKERHGLRDARSQLHFETIFSEFITSHL